MTPTSTESAQKWASSTVLAGRHGSVFSGRLGPFSVGALVRITQIDRGRKHKLCDILVISFCGIFSGCKSWYEIVEFAGIREEFYRSILELPNGIPSHDTFNRVFQILDFQLVESIFRDWLVHFCEDVDHKIISIDGKFLNGSNKEAGNSRSALGMVSAFSTETGICLHTVMTRLEKNKSEKQAMELVIEGLNLKGSLVTLDAGGATPTIANKVIEKEGDYLIGLKGNQKSLKKYCELLFESESKEVPSFITDEKAHGRRDVRRYEQLLVPAQVTPGLEKLKKKVDQKWPELSSFVRVTSLRQKRGDKASEDVRYYFTSAETDVAKLGYAIRSHWKIENNLHWVLDVHFKEDDCRARSGQADANLGLLRRLAVSLIKQQKPEKKTIKGFMMGCAYSDEKLLNLLYKSSF